jgi:hypothetical protein
MSRIPSLCGTLRYGNTVEPVMKETGLHAGWLAGVVFAGVLLAMGTLLDGYSQVLHPVDVLGAAGVPRAGAWNVLGIALPGLLLAAFAIVLQRPLGLDGVGAAGRIGGWLLMLSGLAFAAGARWPLRVDDLDGLASKLHVATAMLAWLAWLPSALLLSWALHRRPGWRGIAVAGCLLALAGVACLGLPLQQWLPALEGRGGAVQRIGLALYFTWPALLAWRALSRAAVSSPGSLPPARR